MHQTVNDEELYRRIEKIKHKIAVMSGKGGVGKSTVTALLAIHLAKNKRSVGIFDADFLGPSIPKIFGIDDKKVVVSDNGIKPVLTPIHKIKIISIQFFLPEKNAPVIWRGPLIAGAFREILSHVSWGELDFLLFDLPPGTGDVPLTVMQTLKLDGVIMVSSPQELTALIVEKAINMANSLKTRVIGIVENMSFYKCPNCGQINRLFGDNRAKDLAEKYGLEVIAEIPVDPQLAKMCDSGMLEKYEFDPFINFDL